MDWLAQIESAAQTGDPAERRAKLLVLREGPETALGRIDHYLADDDLRREGELMQAETRHALARHNATIREELVRRGDADEAALDEAGMLSHETLDDLEEEGLLEAALAELYPLQEGIGSVVGVARKFDTKLHPHERGSGRFARTYGHVFSKKDKPRALQPGGVRLATHAAGVRPGCGVEGRHVRQVRAGAAGRHDPVVERAEADSRGRDRRDAARADH
jgi:hypothetical protein